MLDNSVSIIHLSDIPTYYNTITNLDFFGRLLDFMQKDFLKGAETKRMIKSTERLKLNWSREFHKFSKIIAITT